MAVHIRLTRVGATRRPAYRVIAIDSRRSRDGRALEILGYYNPLTDPVTVKLDDERIQYWVSHGAKPSDAVQRLMKVASDGPRPAGVKAEAREKSRSAKKAAKAEAETKAVATPASAEEPPPVDEPAPEEPTAEAAPGAERELAVETPADEPGTDDAVGGAPAEEPQAEEPQAEEPQAEEPAADAETAEAENEESSS